MYLNRFSTFYDNIFKGVHPKEGKEKERVGNIKWKKEIILQLNKRNLKEFSNIDKISIPYENDVIAIIYIKST